MTNSCGHLEATPDYILPRPSLIQLSLLQALGTHGLVSVLGHSICCFLCTIFASLLNHPPSCTTRSLEKI
ncbi:hypothetical protein BsWGS_26236 [Bradybaena similaris]